MLRSMLCGMIAPQLTSCFADASQLKMISTDVIAIHLD